MSLWQKQNLSSENLSLNPYSNGTYSMSYETDGQRRCSSGLNPYSNGTYSMSYVCGRA